MIRGAETVWEAAAGQFAELLRLEGSLAEQADALAVAGEGASEAMLAADLAYRQSPACPAPHGTGLVVARAPGDGLAMETSSRTEAEDFIRSSRDLRTPGKPAVQ